MKKYLQVQLYQLLLRLTIITIYRSFIRNKTAFTTHHYLTRWISKFPWCFEIQWVRLYQVNFMGSSGIINAIVYKIEAEFTGLWYG